VDEETAYDDDAWGYMAEDDDLAFCEYDDGAWDGDDDEFEEYDPDAAYYNETLGDPAEDDYGFDPAEYDGCYASYGDARKCFNELRMSRGFLPVVALTDSNSQALSASGQPPVNPKGKGKKGKGKGRNGKNNYKYVNPPMKPHDPKGRAQAALGPQSNSATHSRIQQAGSKSCSKQCQQATSK
jgi:hypothetical protein